MCVHEVDAEIGKLMKSVGSEMDDLLSRVWPDGLPRQDELVLASLSPEKRLRLAQRLKAILAITAPVSDEERTTSVKDAAAIAGVQPSRVYGLLSAWKQSPHLASLGVHAADSLNRSSGISDSQRDRIKRRALTLTKENPGLSAGAIRTMMLAEGGEMPSPATLIKLIEAARRESPPGRFGCKIIIDSAGLDLLDPEGLRLRLYAVIDGGTGVVLGASVATDRSLALGAIHAAEDALGGIAELDIDHLDVCANGPEVDIRFDPDDTEGRALIAQRMQIADPPSSTSERHYGRAVIRNLGNRLGRIWLGVGKREGNVSYRTGREAALPSLDVSNLWMIEDAIGAHNAKRLGLAAGAARPEDQRAALERVRSRLRELVELEPLMYDLPLYAPLKGDFAVSSDG